MTFCIWNIDWFLFAILNIVSAFVFNFIYEREINLKFNSNTALMSNNSRNYFVTINHINITWVKTINKIYLYIIILHDFIAPLARVRIRHSIVASITACHAVDQGSIPCDGVFFPFLDIPAMVFQYHNELQSCWWHCMFCHFALL